MQGNGTLWFWFALRSAVYSATHPLCCQQLFVWITTFIFQAFRRHCQMICSHETPPSGRSNFKLLLRPWALGKKLRNLIKSVRGSSAPEKLEMDYQLGTQCPPQSWRCHTHAVVFTRSSSMHLSFCRMHEGSAKKPNWEKRNKISSSKCFTK